MYSVDLLPSMCLEFVVVKGTFIDTANLTNSTDYVQTNSIDVLSDKVINFVLTR